MDCNQTFVGGLVCCRTVLVWLLNFIYIYIYRRFEFRICESLVNSECQAKAKAPEVLLPPQLISETVRSAGQWDSVQWSDLSSV